MFGLENKTFRWSFIESIEPPRVTQIRTQEMFGKDNLFAQVTIRMHTKQVWSAIILLEKGKIYLVEEMWWNHLDSTPHLPFSDTQ